ncbi:hypothetical protein [Candidatus Electronema sp. JM]|uniref:hypothetical protein n=1 Tax=Candidatus Electronema sp. JM TaxID=3401571 RepID=UPI003AA8FDFE
MLTGEQLYAIANLYNTGVAIGFAQAFAAASNWCDMDIAYSQAREYWPGGPIAQGSFGAAITHDQKTLPTFPWNPAPEPRSFPGTYQFMRDNERNIIQILLARTPYAHYTSFGALIAILEVNASEAKGNKYPKCMIGWNNGMKTLDTLIPFANDICRPAESDWRTPLNVSVLRELREKLSRFEGPHVIEIGGIGNVGDYFYCKVNEIRSEFGNTIAKFAESGVHGAGCVWPRR